MQTVNKLSILLVGSIMLLATLCPALAISGAMMAPKMDGVQVSESSWSSSNWCGYAVTGSSGSVTSASGSWTVPAVTGASGGYAAFWTGIDGFSSSTVEQTGTLSETTANGPVYYAWYEFYPSPMYQITSMQVNPGDKISATVKYTGSSTSKGFFRRTTSTFSISISDTTTGKSFSTSASVANAARTSAEWIAEAPSSSGGVLPLANFGTGYLGSDYTSVTGTCYCSLGGTSAPIGSFGSAVQSITMVSKSGAVKASTSGLSTDGTSFTATWVSAGP